jgi:tetratricopeptide (TPR) repeat protein
MGAALKNKDDPEAAIDCYKQALKIKPDYAEAYYNMGNTLKNKDDPEAAIDSYKQALKIKPDYADVFNNMGVALKDKGDPEAAIESYKQALKIKPDYAVAYNNMGNALSDKGDPEAAIDSYKQAIKIKPDYALVYRNLSNINRYKEHDEYFLKMQSLCQDLGITDEQRCNLNFALSKASEDLNEVGQSFNYLKIGNELRKKILSYDIKKDIEMFNQLKKSYPSIALQSVVESSELKPIFILGMPRSGTTLVEQIVSSHSEVTGAGELTYVHKFGESIVRGAIKPNAKIILDFRQRYIEALKKRSDARSIVTDKMPQNFLYVGLIFSAFPDAKVIHVNRDPAATCWSNYKQHFTSKGFGYSYDLDDIVRYFGLYKDLMQFWLSHYGDRIYNLNYDNLTINQDDETRRLIQYLELEWENDCLSPQHNKRSVRTASQQQVRQKVYQGSSQQWRKFEPYLNGVFDQLTELN